MEANPGYVIGQIARALTTEETHPDPATRERAQQRIARWVAVFQGMLSGALQIGSRTPVGGTPAWATLEVIGGGFATGALLAGGPLQPHERALLQPLPPAPEGAERAVINGFYLSDPGIGALQALLASGRYRIQVPEEGALLALAWLLAHNRAEEARAMLEPLGPWLGRLRFYPVPAAQPLQAGAGVFRQPVGQTIAALEKVAIRPAFAREREAVLVWAPLYDEAVSLALETIEGTAPSVLTGADGAPLRDRHGNYQVAGGLPFQRTPEGWHARAQALLDRYGQLRPQHRLVAKPDFGSEGFGFLRYAIAGHLGGRTPLSDRDRSWARVILASFAFKRGLPGSPRHQALREGQQQRAQRPTRADFAQALSRRLRPLPADEGLVDLAPAVAPLTAEEAQPGGIAADHPIPSRLVRKVMRSLVAAPEELVARGVLPSGEALAQVVPQLSAQARVAGVADPELRRLYGALYTAFRRRRSLLLLHLQHQVTFEELPWVAAIDGERPRDEQTRAEAHDLLRRVVGLALTAFPQQILPNPLLREIRALAESAGLSIPVVDELAPDIFMGSFSAKFLRAAQIAGGLLAGTLYERYYGLDYAQVLRIDDVQPSRFGTHVSPAFDRLCHSLAGADAAHLHRSVARNGTIIEQAQILTTHNLAPLFIALNLAESPDPSAGSPHEPAHGRDAPHPPDRAAGPGPDDKAPPAPAHGRGAPHPRDTTPPLTPQLPDMAWRCFTWICATLQTRRGQHKAGLRAIKNSAYAWRQLVFYLSQMPADVAQATIMGAEEYLAAQPEALQSRLRPALHGLTLAAAGAPLSPPARRLLGWTTGPHWLAEG